jgi:hypothetical protein
MPASNGHHRGSRSGRAIRRRVASGFAVPFLIGGLAIGGLAAGFGPSTAELFVVAIALAWAAIGAGLVMLYRAVIRYIFLLENERAGLQQAFDRARLDSLRDGLTGLGNHRAFQEELDDQILEATSTTSRRPTTCTATPPATSSCERSARSSAPTCAGRTGASGSAATSSRCCCPIAGRRMPR